MDPIWRWFLGIHSAPGALVHSYCITPTQLLDLLGLLVNLLSAAAAHLTDGYFWMGGGKLIEEAALMVILCDGYSSSFSFLCIMALEESQSKLRAHP